MHQAAQLGTTGAGVRQPDSGSPLLDRLSMLPGPAPGMRTMIHSRPSWGPLSPCQNSSGASEQVSLTLYLHGCLPWPLPFLMLQPEAALFQSKCVCGCLCAGPWISWLLTFPWLPVTHSVQPKPLGLTPGSAHLSALSSASS